MKSYKELSLDIKKILDTKNNWWSIIAGPALFLLVYYLLPNPNPKLYPVLVPAVALAAWVVAWWILEPIPIYITAFIPLILGNLLGLAKLSDISQEYGNEMVFLFLGGFMLARGIEKYNIHKNIAALIVKRTGSSPVGVLAGFIVATAFLSMWLSNTGTTIMMLPMAITVLEQIPEGKFKNRYSLALLLSIAYAASIGGMATIIGSPPNIQMSGILKASYHIEVDFIKWSLFGLPIAIVLLLCFFVYFKKFVLIHDDSVTINFSTIIEWNNNQKRILLIFILTVFGWIFKPFINSYFNIELSDSQIALMATLALFIISKSKSEEKLLNWNDTKEIPWGILFLFGGGLALAKILKNGGVLDYFAYCISHLGIHNEYILISIIVVFAIFITELISNLALVSVAVPMVAALAQSLNIDIVGMCLPLTIAASCAFMLPLGTPPNAIVFATQRIKVKQMATIGFVMNIISIVVIILSFMLYKYFVA